MNPSKPNIYPNVGALGNIEVLYGLTAMEAIIALGTISKRTWPERVVNLMDGQLCGSLPGYVPTEGMETLMALRGLIGALKIVSSQAELLSLHGPNDEICKAALCIVNNVNLNMASVEKAPTGITMAFVDQVIKMGEKICAVNRQDPRIDAKKALQEIENTLRRISPETGSELGSLTDLMNEQLGKDLYTVRRFIQEITKYNIAGSGGPGGSSPHGAKPGARGNDGKTQGLSKAQALGFDGRKGDLDVLQAYIFPEQCQMLLNKADDLFFTSDARSLVKASEIYNQLLLRLQVLDAIPTTTTRQPKASKSGLEKAWDHLEVDAKITNNPIGQLRSVYEQAKNRRNRLLLGQDMFGHVGDWVPRLSFGFYAQSVDKRFKVLEATEKITHDYETAFQEGNDLKTEVNNGIDSMVAAEAEAKAKRDALTALNGPLLMGIYKIISLSAEMKTKRGQVKAKMATITFNYNLDPQLVLDGLATLANLKPDLSSLVSLAKKGYDAYKSTTTVENLKGDAVRKDFIIDQLEQCEDKLESLDSALKSSKNHQIAIDDPGALKVLASSNDIKQLLRSFKNAIPTEQIKDIDDLLDKYIDVTLRRNNAVLDYNSSIQLLLEALHTEEYCKSQADRLGERRLRLDPNIPAIVFWLRKTRDNMRLALMQRMNYESRAIRYWGLRGDLEFSQPSPLRTALQLRQSQQSLDNAFEQSLSNYASNIRVTWPRDDTQKGLFYKLNPSQLATLKTPQASSNSSDKGSSSIYTVSIRLEPGNQPFGTGRADIRITQVRLWLAGVVVDEDDTHRRLLQVEIAHTGDETFEDSNHSQFHFAHDLVNIQFSYDTAKAQTIEEFDSKVVFGKQGIESNWSGGDQKPTATSFAAIGPFTNWRFAIKEAENTGLDMRHVTEAYIEFSGANRPFSTKSRR